MADEPQGWVPKGAAENCPGTESEKAGSAAACQGCPNQQTCATLPKGPDPDLVAIEKRLRAVKHKILVLSGKGGVGKSTFAAQLAFALAQHQREVGLLDIDICGPSVPRMLGLEGEEIHQSGAGWSPVYVEDNLAVMSIGFMLPNKDDPIIWRGPRKNSLIKQFLKDVDWGDIDYLVVDAPPGTSDEHISIAQYLKASQIDGAVIVTTPQEVSLLDVRKEINFCKKVGIPILGVVENMSGLREAASRFAFKARAADGCEVDVTDQALKILAQKFPKDLMLETDIFYSEGNGAEQMADCMDVPFLGRIPFDPSLSRVSEEGRSAYDGASSSLPALGAIITKLTRACGDLLRTTNEHGDVNNDSLKLWEGGTDIDPLLGARIHLGF